MDKAGTKDSWMDGWMDGQVDGIAIIIFFYHGIRQLSNKSAVKKMIKIFSLFGCSTSHSFYLCFYDHERFGDGAFHS